MLQSLLRRALPFTNDWDKRWFEIHSTLPKLTHKQANEAKIRLTKYLLKINGGGDPSSAETSVSHNGEPPPLIEASDENFLVSLPQHLAESLLKMIPGFHYVSSEKKYAFPIRNAELASIIIEPYDMRLAKELLENHHTQRWKKQEHWKLDINDTIADTQEILDNFHISLDKHKLLPHQVDAIAFFEAAYGKALLTDVPGTGKSAPVILYNHHHGYETLIMCPKNVLFNWAKEIKKWIPDASINLFTKCTKKTKKYWGDKYDITISDSFPDKDDKPDFFIVNYDVIYKFMDEIMHMRYKSVILDECHELKSWKAQRTRAAICISQVCHNSIIGLSGTPLRNRPAEFYVILFLIAPTIFPDREEYLKRYCGARENKWGGLDTTNATNMEELHEKLKSTMLRRTKDTLNLPPKEIIYKKIPLQRHEEYILLQRRLMQQHYRKPGGPLVIIEELKQEAARQKLYAIEQYIKKENLPLIIFYHHKEIGKYLSERLKHYSLAKIDGSTSDVNRAIIIDQFQNGEVDILLASITAAGVGITLTRSNNVIMLEQAWSPADELQAHDRVHRIGQTKPVTITYLLGKDSIDEAIYKTVKEKQNIIGSIVDGNSIKSVIVRNVIKEIRK